MLPCVRRKVASLKMVSSSIREPPLKPLPGRSSLKLKNKNPPLPPRNNVEKRVAFDDKKTINNKVNNNIDTDTSTDNDNDDIPITNQYELFDAPQAYPRSPNSSISSIDSPLDSNSISIFNIGSTPLIHPTPITDSAIVRDIEYHKSDIKHLQGKIKKLESRKKSLKHKHRRNVIKSFFSI
ncbi:hypothetical protein DAPK24_041410 [Pichia kluyveri]|uniref:Uncharacterized protein n=1 Tax=Pichia kluyveri TaxID=36015 RepID=A0AAV5R8J0_PICKL|nr:hypothetical protein DAPK24_041410 [Pichia kluyveri]